MNFIETDYDNLSIVYKATHPNFDFDSNLLFDVKDNDCA